MGVVSERALRTAAAEGAIIGSFRMHDLKTAASRDGKEISSVGPLFSNKSDMERLARPFARAALAAEAQNLARWLAERPANLMTPRDFARQATSVRDPGVRRAPCASPARDASLCQGREREGAIRPR